MYNLFIPHYTYYENVYESVFRGTVLFRSLQSSKSYMKKVHLVLPPINIPHKEATE